MALSDGPNTRIFENNIKRIGDGGVLSCKVNKKSDLDKF